MDNNYVKHMTRAFTGTVQEAVEFQDVHFERIEKEDIVIETTDVERWGMFDPGRYKKAEL